MGKNLDKLNNKDEPKRKVNPLTKDTTRKPVVEKNIKIYAADHKILKRVAAETDTSIAHLITEAAHYLAEKHNVKKG
ncbi:hypothetical protein ACFPU1_16780 [Thalassorhabdus alkalitolerans]|uniref:Ribbon-helix-helix protein, copG family n=1 Tax=Thalassorhabdus alkalitolerans TaxID=2282697 RepID=A0ABW0YUX3_9BACI